MTDTPTLKQKLQRTIEVNRGGIMSPMLDTQEDRFRDQIRREEEADMTDTPTPMCAVEHCSNSAEYISDYNLCSYCNGILEGGGADAQDTPRTINLTPTWKTTIEILVKALESGSPAGKAMARQELRELAVKLDEQNEEVSV